MLHLFIWYIIYIIPSTTGLLVSSRFVVPLTLYVWLTLKYCYEVCQSGGINTLTGALAGDGVPDFLEDLHYDNSELPVPEWS